ncbi:hypothetical protein UK23_19860 [Lentzea aerocolonigenes]|uniref:SHOCT domain-containing protein n=1 Tax=Lentzea aerocolonigenes TaxID=68170 RepID=A0A0F0GWG5_LENAE|nr:hypothetical protein [Lentzea aerocolonigenes]KJK47630.1 hypothetical protein UK23_19860 [Lentzea aerocolonigenes]
MTWQDELQKLDNELASGRISADDYRRRRDEVLSGSAGSGPAAGPPQQQGAPFAPPFKWQAQQPATPTSDATQVVNVQNQAPSNPDATQVVTPNQQQQHRAQDAERTQFVAPIAPPAGQGGWGPPQQQQQVAPPPWVGGDFDQINQPGGWSHGPEVFDESGGGKGKIIGIVLVVLVVLGLGFGAYWVWGRNVADPNSNLGSGAPTPTSTKPSPPPDPAQVGKMAGDPKQQTDITTFEQIEKLTPPYLTPNEMEVYKTAGGARTKLFHASPAQGSTTTVMIVSATEETTASQCAVDLKNVQVTNGMEAVTTDVPDKVNVTQVPPKDGNPARIRGHYASKKYIVRVDVTGASVTEAMTIFKEAIDAQLKAMPTDA